MTAAGRKLSLSRRDRRDDVPMMPPWPVLVVDDDPQVHEMTRVLLRDFSFEGRGFAAISAFSADEAASMLRRDPNVPVVLLDVVMETPDAGLKLVRHIRQEMGNTRLRIILRTGQPGEAPERDVMLAYDVNDYKAKTELTAQKLFTALVGAVRAWRDIVTIGRLHEELLEANAHLERKVAARTRELQDSRDALARAKERAEVALSRENEARQQLRQFLSMMSHEFRNPLAIIDSAAQLLSLKADKCDKSMLPRLVTIRGAVGRLVELIDTCLADERLETGHLVLHEQAVDLGPILASSREHHLGAGHSIELTLGDLPAVWGDPGLLALVFNNLIGNAAKYSPDNSPIEIEAQPADDGVAVTVLDRGIGIPAEDLPHVFDRFHRAGNAHGIAGSGIGLHMARQIVELHGGTISVSSTVGEGSCFTVRLRPAPEGERGAAR